MRPLPTVSETCLRPRRSQRAQDVRRHRLHDRRQHGGRHSRRRPRRFPAAEVVAFARIARSVQAKRRRISGPGDLCVVWAKKSPVTRPLRGSPSVSMGWWPFGSCIPSGSARMPCAGESKSGGYTVCIRASMRSAIAPFLFKAGSAAARAGLRRPTGLRKASERGPGRCRGGRGRCP